MQKYVKPKFEENTLGINPFIYTLEIPVRTVETNSYELDEGVLLPKQVQLEKTDYTKVFISSERRQIISNLSDKALRLYLWIIYELEPGKDYLWINHNRYMAEQNIKSINTYKSSVEELMRYGMLAMTVKKNVYWINPDFMFNGNRLTKYRKQIKL